MALKQIFQRYPYMREVLITIIVFFGLLFTATNVNQQLGQTYLWFNGGILFLLIIGLLIFNKRLRITYQKQPGGTLQAMGWGLVGWIMLLLISVVVMKIVDPAKANIGSIMLLLGAATPVLATSKIANWLNFSILVPFTETQLWARGVEFFADVFHINLDKRNIKTAGVLGLIIIFCLAFAFFHLTSKGVAAFASLAVVFVMMFISLIYVVIFQETRQANWLHIFANQFACLVSWSIN